METPIDLPENSQVKITGWKGNYTNDETGAATITTFLSDTFKAQDVYYRVSGSTNAKVFHIKYLRPVPTGTTSLNMGTSEKPKLGTLQVRRGGIRLKIEGANFCQPSSHPGSSPICGRVVVVPNSLKKKNALGVEVFPESDKFTTAPVEQTCIHTHNSIELMTDAQTKTGHVRLDTWDVDQTAIAPVAPVVIVVPKPLGHYILSNAMHFDQKTPIIDVVFRKKLEPQRYHAISMVTREVGYVTINMGQLDSKCLEKGTTVTFENAFDAGLNGPHVIFSKPPDASNLLFTIQSNVVVNVGQQTLGTLMVACPTFQTHGVDVLTFSGLYFPKQTANFEILIGDTPPSFATTTPAGGSRRQLVATNQEIMNNYLLKLKTGRTGKKCVLTDACKKELRFADGNKCLTAIKNALGTIETFTVSCIVPSGAGMNHPVVMNLLESGCTGKDKKYARDTR